jgi:L-galactose dehydrogenase
LKGKRDDVIVGTKAGRYRFDEFDFSPRRIRDGLHRSLELLKTDYVDILQLHDIEFVFLDGVFADAYGKLVRLRDEGKCRFIGMTGCPLHTIRRAITETDLDVVLNYAHFTLLNTVAHRPLVADPQANGTAVINATAVALGPLTPAGLKANVPASDALVAASRRADEICAAHGANLAFLVPPRPRRPR